MLATNSAVRFLIFPFHAFAFATAHSHSVCMALFKFCQSSLCHERERACRKLNNSRSRYLQIYTPRTRPSQPASEQPPPPHAARFFLCPRTNRIWRVESDVLDKLARARTLALLLKRSRPTFYINLAGRTEPVLDNELYPSWCRTKPTPATEAL